MKVITSILALVAWALVVAGEDLQCAESLGDPGYNGSVCTLSDVTIKRSTYDWSVINGTEVHFVNSTIPYIPTGLQRHMDRFEVFNLTRVNLQFIDFGDLDMAQNLKQLFLHDNYLDALNDNVFREVKLLELLDVSNNQIRTIQEDAFKGLTNLKSLLLQNNRITVITQQLKHLPNLHVLNLDYNAISSIAPNAVAGMQKLQDIQLRGNQIESLQISLCNGEHLFFDLFNNSANEVQFIWENSCPPLNNSLTVAAPYNHIERLIVDKNIHLLSVDLRYNNLSDIKYLTNFKNLSHLNLSHNSIADLPMNLMKNLTNLQYLDMGFNDLNKVDLANVRELLPNLKWIGFSNNLFECKNQIELRGSLKLQDINTDLQQCDPTLPSVVQVKPIEANLSRVPEEEETKTAKPKVEVVGAPNATLNEKSNVTKIETNTTSSAENDSDESKEEDSDNSELKSKIKKLIKDYGAYIILTLFGVVFILLLAVITLIYECRKRKETEISHFWELWGLNFCNFLCKIY